MVTRSPKPQIDTRGLQGPEADTFHALTVPFKGVPRRTGVGDNYTRLAESLGQFSKSLDSLGSLGLALDKKNKSDKLDAETQSALWAHQKQSSASDTVGFVAATGVNPTGDAYTNITKLNTDVLPGYEKQFDDWRKAQDENPNGWMTAVTDDKGQPVNGPDGQPQMRRMTDADIKAKYSRFITQAASQYPEANNVYKPQFQAILQFGQNQMAKELDAFHKSTEAYVINQGLTAAADNAPVIMKSLGGDPAVSAQQLADGLSSNMGRIATEASGKNVQLDGKQRLEIFKRGVQSITESARTDETQAYLLEMMLRDGRLPTGALIKSHPELSGVANDGLRVANETLLKAQHDRDINDAKSILSQSKLPLNLAINSDIVTNRVDALGETKTLKTSREDLVKQFASEADRQIEVDGAQVGSSPESILQKKVQNAALRGYVSPSIQAFFEGSNFDPSAPLDNAAQDRVATALATYQLLKKTAPLSIHDYVKDGKSRNYLDALDLMAQNSGGTVDTASLYSQLQANLDDEGRPVNALANYRDDLKSWSATDTAKNLSAKDMQAVKDVFNMTYGSERNLTDIPAKLDAIATRVNAGGYELNGSVIPMPEPPAGVTREKFVGQTNEYVGDVLKQYAPEYKLSDVKAMPVYGGSSFVLRSAADGRVVTRRDNGQPVMLSFKDVVPYLDKKAEPFRKAEMQKRANSIAEIEKKKLQDTNPYSTTPRSGKPVLKPTVGLLNALRIGLDIATTGKPGGAGPSKKEDKPMPYAGRGSKPAPTYGKGGPLQ